MPFVFPLLCSNISEKPKTSNEKEIEERKNYIVYSQDCLELTPRVIENVGVNAKSLEKFIEKNDPILYKSYNFL